jgi:hypothetical protein
MVLATTESKLYVSATLMLLNAEIWKESLGMFSIVILFIHTFVKIGYVIQIWVWCHLFANPDCVVTSKSHSYVRRRKVSKNRHFVSGPYKNMCTVIISKHQVKQKFFTILLFGYFLQGIVVASECKSDVTFDICSSVHCLGFSDDCVWCCTAAVCSLPPSRGTEVKRPFQVISYLVTSRHAGTCIGKPVFLLQDEHRLGKGSWTEYLNLSSRFDYPTLSLLYQC